MEPSHPRYTQYSNSINPFPSTRMTYTFLPPTSFEQWSQIQPLLAWRCPNRFPSIVSAWLHISCWCSYHYNKLAIAVYGWHLERGCEPLLSIKQEFERNPEHRFFHPKGSMQTIFHWAADTTYGASLGNILKRLKSCIYVR